VLRDPRCPSSAMRGRYLRRRMVRLQLSLLRKVAPELRQVVQDDGKVRLVLKDWRSSASLEDRGTSDARRQIPGQFLPRTRP